MGDYGGETNGTPRWAYLEGSLCRPRGRDSSLKEVPLQRAKERGGERCQNVPGGGNSMYKHLEVEESMIVSLFWEPKVPGMAELAVGWGMVLHMGV